MLNLSIVINNQNPENLISIINLLKDKITNQDKIELIITNKQQYNNQENTDILDIVNAQCQKKNILFKTINLKNNELIGSKLSEVITGDIVIFTSSSYTPDEYWLENIISELSKSSVYILTGKIIEPESEQKQNSINSSFLNKNHKNLDYIQIWQKQMGNLVIRKERLKKINYFKFLNYNDCHDLIYCRILRELEHEIKYLPNAIVRANIEHP